MQAAVAASSALERLLDNLVVGQLPLLDGLVDADNVLPDDTSGSDVQMADLGVAHQALGQADGEGGGLELGEAIGVVGQAVHDRRLGIGDGVAILGALVRGNAPAINDDCRSARARELATRARGSRG